MLDMLEELANIDSNSYYKGVVDLLGACLIPLFNEHKIDYTTSPPHHHGDVIRAVVLGGYGNKPIMLCGRGDSVFPKKGVFRRLINQYRPIKC